MPKVGAGPVKESMKQNTVSLKKVAKNSTHASAGAGSPKKSVKQKKLVTGDTGSPKKSVKQKKLVTGSDSLI
jgi:hypothetical protein